MQKYQIVVGTGQAGHVLENVRENIMQQTNSRLFYENDKNMFVENTFFAQVFCLIVYLVIKKPCSACGRPPSILHNAN